MGQTKIKLVGFLAFSALFLVSAQIQVSSALNEETAKERACFEILKPVEAGRKWFRSVKTWYFPMSHRLELYRDIQDMVETDFENITASTVNNESCLQFRVSFESYKIRFALEGLNGKSALYNTVHVGKGLADFWSEWSQNSAGRDTTVLTDNKTYIVKARCYSDDQMTWSVISTKKKLDEKTKRKILHQIKSLGFSTKFIEEVNYDSCA